LNVLVIVSDTFRRDHLAFYSGGPVRTPSLDRLAGESVAFDRAYSCSFPTLPCRAELFTGRFVFPYLDWGPMPAKGPTLAGVFGEAGYTTALVTDNLPLSHPKYGYDRGFHSRIRVRGQWYDNFRPPDTPFAWPCTPEKSAGSKPGRVEQYLRNTAGRRSLEDWFAPQVIREASDWLEKHHARSPFFLWVDIFDPHEPWDPPRELVDLYDPDGTGEDVIYPAYGQSSRYSAEDLKRIRALYAAEVTMVDREIGKLLDRLEALGRRDDTLVLFLSDHGILLGERGLIGKMGGRHTDMRGWPLYPELARIPMLWRAPGVEPGRRECFVHPGDAAPTLLELAGVRVPAEMNTASLVPVLRQETEHVRDVAVSSWSLKGTSPYRPSTIRTDDWAMTFRRSGIEPELYDRRSDPDETKNVYARNTSAARELHRRYLRFLRESHVTTANGLPRSWLLTWQRPGREELMFLPEQLGQPAGSSGKIS
jgi:arylsulfatase A-like enzyme